ncbi:ribonuclease J [Candidatus Parcubacteria bacterium]|nr:ribonuclease J [Candidatus Parcubacteria bacterium]
MQTQTQTQTQVQQNLRIIPLGGLGEVGRNMTLLEYKGQILIIDMGFRMPEEDMPGIDYIIPNINYLKGKEKNILGVVFTHGHYDHIGAVPYFIGKLGNPRIFTAPLTKGIILKRQEDFPNQPQLDITDVKDGSKIELGPFRIEFFRMNHNIPDNLGLFIETPVGNILHTSDFKFDHSPVNDLPTDIGKLKQFGQRGILLLMSDSTGSEQEGHSLSEREIQKNLEKIFISVHGRIITATFSSLINRIQQIIALSEKYNRKVAVMGFSMKNNIELCRNLGYIKAKKGTIISSKQISKFPDEQITLICTGAQGEGTAALMRIANGEHPHFRFKKGDSVIFSSSVIPGNERTVQILKDDILRQGVKVFHYKMMDIHAGGHAQQEELKQMFQIMRPKFLMPIHGQYSMMVNNAELARSVGIPEANIIIAENGQIIDLNQERILIEKKTIPCSYVMVDGLGVGDVGEIVLRDRHMLGRDGMFVIVAIVDKKTKKVKGSPDIISRGFVYLRESKPLLAETRRRTIRIINQAIGHDKGVNWVYVKDELRSKINEFLFKETQRRPIVLPVIIEV